MDHWSPFLNSSTIFLTALMAIALDVKVGLQDVSAGILPLPPTNRLVVPQTLESSLHVDVNGFLPIRVVPMKWREDPLGITLGSTPFR